MKCALQEFQHMFPHLTSRLKTSAPQTVPNAEEMVSFVPMECPILPLDTKLTCTDMLHTPFDEENGPLWRVQHVTEAIMDAANLVSKSSANMDARLILLLQGFGPELSAIVEDEADEPTRWRYFLRYMQGKVNQRTIDPFDSTEEGYRNFIIFTFHPSVTDTVGVFHLLRQFLVILDSILALDGNTAPLPDVGVAGESHSLPPPIEQLIHQQLSYATIKEWSGFNSFKEYIYSRKSPLEFLGGVESPPERGHAHVLRGWLSEAETRELLAIMDEDDVSLHGVILAATLTSLSRMLDNENLSCPSLKVANDLNLRQFCSSAPKLGCLNSCYEAEYSTQDIASRSDFWKYSHELTVKHNQAKDQFTLRSGSHRKTTPYSCDMAVSSYGNLGLLFRNKSFFSEVAMDSIDTWSKPLNEVLQTNIRLEDVFHVVNGRDVGVPFLHSVHVLHGKLNYILVYDTNLIRDQRHALMVRDETINVLRMAVDSKQD